MELLPFFVLDLLGLFATGAERARRRRERAQAMQALERVAASLGGRVVQPWFLPPRVEGRIDGRDVRIVWLGDGQAEVYGPAPEILEVWARRPGWSGWLFRLFRGARVEAGGASTDHHAAARHLIDANVVDRVEAKQGRIQARGRPGASASAILGFAEGTLALAWQPLPDLAARVRAQPRAPEAAAPTIKLEPSAAAGLRCPFCHDALAPEGVVVHCASCDAPHHPTCFEEGDGCSIAGCAQRAARGVRTRA